MNLQRIGEEKAKAVSDIYYAIDILHQRFVTLLTGAGYPCDNKDFTQTLRLIQRNQSSVIPRMRTFWNGMMTVRDAERAIDVRNKYSHQQRQLFDPVQYQQDIQYLERIAEFVDLERESLGFSPEARTLVDKQEWKS